MQRRGKSYSHTPLHAFRVLDYLITKLVRQIQLSDFVVPQLWMFYFSKDEEYCREPRGGYKAGRPRLQCRESINSTRSPSERCFCSSVRNGTHKASSISLNEFVS